ncbi:MAG: hypothetical protein OQK03_13795 [Colwellia sp.]|nr:hypothetical protein [Colwellia sp.]
MTTTSKYSLLAGAVLFTLSSVALANEDAAPVSIPMLENAQVFADFTDDMPAVLNYFTRASEAQVIEFYQQHFGEAISQERKRGRLTLSYQQEKRMMRVVISQQNNKRQVDVIVEKAQE